MNRRLRRDLSAPNERGAPNGAGTAEADTGRVTPDDAVNQIAAGRGYLLDPYQRRGTPEPADIELARQLDQLEHTVEDPMILLANRLEVEHWRQALERHVQIHGRDGVPDSMLTALDIVRHHTAPSRTVTGVDGCEPRNHALMARTEAARLLGVHPNTISRWADQGQLRRVGRQITAASVHRLLESKNR